MSLRTPTAAELVLLGFPALVACQPTATSTSIPSLDRPAGISFACFSDSANAFTDSLASCQGVTGASSEDLHLMAFVLESARGEVATLDWNVSRAVDSNRTVPGFTFFRVGEAPRAILTPEDWSKFTFVANGGSFSVQSIETASFHPDATPDPIARPTVVPMPAPPTDLAYALVGGVRHLFVALPSLGQLADLVVADDGSLGSPVFLAVGAAVPSAVPDADPVEFERLCPTDRFVRSPVPNARTPRSFGSSPAPSRLVLLERAGSVELLANDEALPMIHRFTLTAAGATEVAGFATEVPTLALAATPLVPAAYADATASVSATEQYVYAVDAVDRSVLALDVTTGAVLDVNVGDVASDRIPLSSRAFALEVLTPSYDLGTDPTLAARCNPADTSTDTATSAGPSELRGVFLGVSTMDGNLSFVDVYDLDAPCRGTTACAGRGNTSDTLVSIRRHRPRIGALVTRDPGIATTLSFNFEGTSGRLATTGQPSSGEGPGLDPVQDADPATDYCPGVVSSGGRGQMFAALSATGDASVEGKPLFCLLDDAQALRPQRWLATYEATVPTSQGARGWLDDVGGVHLFQTEDASFCEVGVLGARDVSGAAGLGPDDPETGYGGDMLVITSALPPATAADEACADFAAESGGRKLRIGFSILEAHADHLVLGDFIPDAGFALSSALNANPAGVFDLAKTCFPDAISYEVRVHGAYIVLGADSRPRHRVVDDGTGRCTVDVAGKPYDPLEPDTARSFRAMPGRTFVHPQVAFRISAYQVPSGVTAQLLFDVVDTPTSLRIDGGTFSTHASFNRYDGRLYVVDTTGIAVRQYGLGPVTPLESIR